MDLRLDGKRVILTAGAAGIGLVTLKTFIERVLMSSFAMSTTTP